MGKLLEKCVSDIKNILSNENDNPIVECKDILKDLASKNVIQEVLEVDRKD